MKKFKFELPIPTELNEARVTMIDGVPHMTALAPDDMPYRIVGEISSENHPRVEITFQYDSGMDEKTYPERGKRPSTVLHLGKLSRRVMRIVSTVRAASPDKLQTGLQDEITHALLELKSSVPHKQAAGESGDTYYGTMAEKVWPEMGPQVTDIWLKQLRNEQ